MGAVCPSVARCTCTEPEASWQDRGHSVRTVASQQGQDEQVSCSR